MDEKGKVLEPVLEEEELDHADGESEPEPHEERTRGETVSVSEVKRDGESNRGQAELRRCQQPPARVGLDGEGRQLSHLISRPGEGAQ